LEGHYPVNAEASGGPEFVPECIDLDVAGRDGGSLGESDAEVSDVVRAVVQLELEILDLLGCEGQTYV
jgi:hypothetical protein